MKVMRLNCIHLYGNKNVITIKWNKQWRPKLYIKFKWIFFTYSLLRDGIQCLFSVIQTSTQTNIHIRSTLITEYALRSLLQTYFINFVCDEKLCNRPYASHTYSWRCCCCCYCYSVAKFVTAVVVVAVDDDVVVVGAVSSSICERSAQTSSILYHGKKA